MMINNAMDVGDYFGEPDNLSVTFWGTEYFKSSAGHEVMFGSEVRMKMIRQINLLEAEQIDKSLVYIKGYIVAIVLLILSFFSLGSLLPMWIFVNSLQIITHTTLLKTMMPGNAFLVLKQYLDMLRFNWYAFNEVLYDRNSDFGHRLDTGLYNIYLQSSDYVHLFAENLTIVTMLAGAIGLVWAILALKNCFGPKPRSSKPSSTNSSRKHEQQANNFAVRFFYEMFLEFCLCALINITIFDFSSFSSAV